MTHLLTVDPTLIDWSRAQFALTAIYHWLFVPLTLGLALIMGIMAATLRRELRHGRCYGHHPRVRVWHQLEQLLVVRGRHLRRTTRH